MAQPIRTRPRFPHSQLWNLPQASYAYPSEGIQNENHSHRKLIKLITWTTALSRSMKLWAMPCRATQDGRVMVESSHKTWSTGEGKGKPLQYSCLENPMNSMKRQKDRTLKDEFQGRSDKSLRKEWRDGAKAKTTPSYGCDWWWKSSPVL